MNTQQDFIEFGKAKFNQWRTIMEEMELQLALGKAEARDTFEDEKKKVSKFINEQKAQLHQAEKKAAKHQLEFAKQLQDLQFAISDFSPKTKSAFDQGQKSILHTIHEVEHTARTAFEEVDERAKFQIGGLKNALDAYRIELALSSFEAKKVSESKETLMAQLEKTMKRLNRTNAEGEGKVEQFMDEISESFTHLKNAFTEVLK